MYFGDPSMLPVRVSPVVSPSDSLSGRILAMPKSRIFTTISPDALRARKRFAGLISRWITRARCACESPSQAWAAIRSATSGGSTLSRFSVTWRSSPSSSSITMNGRPEASSVPQSSVRATCSPWIAAAAFASRRKRVSFDASSLLDASRIISECTSFTATRAPVVSSIASWTTPIPPWPSRAWIRYLEARREPIKWGRWYAARRPAAGFSGRPRT